MGTMAAKVRFMPLPPLVHCAASVRLGSKPPFVALVTKVCNGPEAVMAAIASKVRFADKPAVRTGEQNVPFYDTTNRN